jgi:hypothetical protein
LLVMSGKRATRAVPLGAAGAHDRNRRADLADAMMQEFKRLIAARLSAGGRLPTRKQR